MQWTAQELDKLPTLAVAQADNLKIDSEGVRVWVSRCDVADGEPLFDAKVTIERFRKGRWMTETEYEG